MRFLNEASKTVLALVAGTAAVIAVALSVGAMAVFGFGWFSNATANFRGNVQVQNQTKGSGAFRIAAYNQFFDLCTSIQTFEASIQNIADELKTNPSQTRKEELYAAITANKNERAATIAQYNNDAAKSYTVGQFRASNLPYHLDVTEVNTQCAV